MSRVAGPRCADQIIVLREGKIEAAGRRDDLLEPDEEMQRLWQGDIAEQRSKMGRAQPHTRLGPDRAVAAETSTVLPHHVHTYEESVKALG